MSQKLKFSIGLTAMVIVLSGGLTALLAFGQPAAAPAVASLPPDVWRWGLLCATFSTALSSIAAAYAVAKLGSAAIGAITEKPDLFGRLVIFVGLAEGLAIYGLIVSVLILNRLV